MKLRREVKVAFAVLLVLTGVLIGLLAGQRVVEYLNGFNARLSALEARPQELKVSVVTPTASPSATPVKRVTTVAPTSSR